jgi:DNA helicase II / ATP-dependent DNA helicase PcrA
MRKIRDMSQESLINSDATRVRCVAGPGTGKTWSIKKKVMRIFENPQDIPKVFAVTYTRLAAEQLKQDLCDPDLEYAGKITASTLHAFAFKILQQEQAIQALGRNSRPCLSTELNVLKHDLAADFNGVKHVREKLNAFSSMWARLQNEEVGWPQNEEDQRFHLAYQKWMKFHKCISIDELIALVVGYLRDNPVNEVSNKYSHIIVDEYQDLNKADQTFIDLVGINSNMLIVGDDDQSIYSFRNANPEGIREWFDIQQEPKEDIQLTECRRCDGKILTLANTLIRNNSGRIRADLVPMAGRENLGEIDIVQWNTRNNETDGLAQGIKKLIECNKVPEGESILVLVPRKEFGIKLKEALDTMGVTDSCLKTSPDWESKVLGEKICLAQLYEDREDLVALRYWLGLKNQNWHREKYRILYEYCLQNLSSPTSVLPNAVLCEQLKIKVLHDRYNELVLILNSLEKKSIDEMLDQLFPLTGETETLGKIIRDIKEDSPEDFSFRKAIIEAIITHTEESSNAKIQIMTFHGAKGLTSHTVVITGLINGILPTVPNATMTETKKLEEERRLLFVALTRAKNRVILSSFRKATRGENKNLRLGLSGNSHYPETQSSLFLSELGPTRPAVIKGDDWLQSIN